MRLADEHWRLMDGCVQDWLIISDQGRIEIATCATEHGAVGGLFLAGKWNLGEKIYSATPISTRRSKQGEGGTG